MKQYNLVRSKNGDDLALRRQLWLTLTWFRVWEGN